MAEASCAQAACRDSQSAKHGVFEQDRGHRYHVKPHQCLQLVEVFYKHARIATHKRSYAPKERYVTISTHLPKDKQSAGKWNGTTLREWALRVGDSTFAAVNYLLTAAKYEQHAYRTCLALLNLTQIYPDALLELVSKEAIASGKESFRQIKLLSKELNRQGQKKDQEADEKVNPHGVTRGAEYFEMLVYRLNLDRLQRIMTLLS